MRGCIALILVLAVLADVAAAGLRRRMPPLPRARSSAHAARSAPPATTFFFSQPIDHFNPESNSGNYQQRVLYNKQYWGKGAAPWASANTSCPGPIFFYTGNESPVTDYWSNSGFMTQVLAQEHGALVVFAEHRYFGDSMPFGNASFLNANVGYLSPDQALADYANLLTTLKETMFNGAAKECPVVSFGGSYGGMLTAWFRMKYPNIVIGGLAASAPFGFYGTGLSPYAYMDAAQASYHDASPHCDVQLAAAIQQMVTDSNSAAGLAAMSAAFPTCSPLVSQDDATALIQWVQNALVYMVELDYDEASDYGIQFPAWPVNRTCSALASRWSAESPVEALAFAIQTYYNSTGDRTCVNVTRDVPDFAASPGWDYIFCTSAYQPMAQRGMWWPATTYDPSQDIQSCQQEWNIPLRINWSRIHWGGFDSFAWGSNIIFSNGLIDPWHALGVLSSPNEANSVVAIVIPESAHHADLRGPHPYDPPYVVAARKQESAIIAGWLKKYYTK